MKKQAAVPTAEPDAAWRRRAAGMGFTPRRGVRRNMPLKRTLLGIGGWAAAIPTVEEDLDKIVRRGKVFSEKIGSMPGFPSQCHLNSAMAWGADKSSLSICTGYALSQDGMWRQHSWLVGRGLLFETTEVRLCYYGYVMTAHECACFYDDNL